MVDLVPSLNLHPWKGLILPAHSYGPDGYQIRRSYVKADLPPNVFYMLHVPVGVQLGQIVCCTRLTKTLTRTSHWTLVRSATRAQTAIRSATTSLSTQSSTSRQIYSSSVLWMDFETLKIRFLLFVLVQLLPFIICHQ